MTRKNVQDVVSYKQFYDLIDSAKSVGITGYPGAGKTTLTKRDRIKDKVIIHTDHFLDNPHEDIPGILLSELRTKPKHVIEGTQVVRLFKRGYRPDIVFLVTGTERTDCKGIKTMIDRQMVNFKGPVYLINPRKLTA